MRLLSLASPSRVKRGIANLRQGWQTRAAEQEASKARAIEQQQFLDRCSGERPFVERCLNNQAAVDSWFGKQAFLDRCLAEQGRLEFYLDTRKRLQSFNIEEGTVLFPEEHEFLQELVETANTLPGPIVEIGTLFGFTTSRFALWKKPDKKIVTVDNYSWNPWQFAPAIHRQMTRQFLSYLVQTGQVELVDMDKNTFYSSYQGEPPAMVFFDSIHDYEETKKDIAWAKRVGAKIISGHDYHEDFPGVVKAVAEAGGLGARTGVVWTLKSDLIKPVHRAA